MVKPGKSQSYEQDVVDQVELFFARNNIKGRVKRKKQQCWIPLKIKKQNGNVAEGTFKAIGLNQDFDVIIDSADIGRFAIEVKAYDIARDPYLKSIYSKNQREEHS